MALNTSKCNRLTPLHFKGLTSCSEASLLSPISLVHHHHPALLHRYDLILDRLSTFLMAFSTLVLKPYFSQSLSLHSHLSLAQAELLEFDHSVLGGHWWR